MITCLTPNTHPKHTTCQNANQKPLQSTVTYNRRVLFASTFLGSVSLATASFADPIPPAPLPGDCPDCIGVVNDTLNTCNLSSQSCISTLNDDELHFVPPWQYDSSTDDAATRLIDVATGGTYQPGFVGQSYGISNTDAAGFIAKGVLSVVTGQALPEKPKAQRAQFVPFDGKLIEKSTTDKGATYVRIAFGLPKNESETEVEDPAKVIDAEFLFFPNDSIVNVRASSRTDPQSSSFPNQKDIQLSLTSGFIVDRNIARRTMEDLRKALGWEVAPVITDFDPRFNPEAPLWFERLFMPFSERNNFQPSGEAYPQE